MNAEYFFQVQDSKSSYTFLCKTKVMKKEELSLEEAGKRKIQATRVSEYR